MATTLPGSPPAFDREDVAGTVKALCAYTRTLQESLDFILGQTRKSIQAADENIDATKKDLNAMATGYVQLEARVSALEQKNA